MKGRPETTRRAYQADADRFRYEGLHYRWRLYYWTGQLTAALADLSAEGAVAEESGAAVCDMLLDRLRSDNDRHVRIAAARGLGYYAEKECVEALIVGLRDDHFAVAHECENALVRLTGRTHDCNALAWSDWYEANGEDLFAAAGEIPESRRPKYRNRWGKFAYNTKQLFRWLYPGKKEE